MNKKRCPMTGREVSTETCFGSCCIVDCSTLLSESNLVLEKDAEVKKEPARDVAV